MSQKRKKKPTLTKEKPNTSNLPGLKQLQSKLSQFKAQQCTTAFLKAYKPFLEQLYKVLKGCEKNFVSPIYFQTVTEYVEVCIKYLQKSDKKEETNFCQYVILIFILWNLALEKQLKNKVKKIDLESVKKQTIWFFDIFEEVKKIRVAYDQQKGWFEKQLDVELPAKMQLPNAVKIFLNDFSNFVVLRGDWEGIYQYASWLMSDISKLMLKTCHPYISDRIVFLSFNLNNSVENAKIPEKHRQFYSELGQWLYKCIDNIARDDLISYVFSDESALYLSLAVSSKTFCALGGNNSLDAIKLLEERLHQALDFCQRKPIHQPELSDKYWKEMKDYSGIPMVIVYGLTQVVAYVTAIQAQVLGERAVNIILNHQLLGFLNDSSIQNKDSIAWLIQAYRATKQKNLLSIVDEISMRFPQYMKINPILFVVNRLSILSEHAKADHYKANELAKQAFSIISEILKDPKHANTLVELDQHLLSHSSMLLKIFEDHFNSIFKLNNNLSLIKTKNQFEYKLLKAYMQLCINCQFKDATNINKVFELLMKYSSENMVRCWLDELTVSQFVALLKSTEISAMNYVLSLVIKQLGRQLDSTYIQNLSLVRNFILSVPWFSKIPGSFGAKYIAIIVKPLEPNLQGLRNLCSIHKPCSEISKFLNCEATYQLKLDKIFNQISQIFVRKKQNKKFGFPYEKELSNIHEFSMLIFEKRTLDQSEPKLFFKKLKQLIEAKIDEILLAYSHSNPQKRIKITYFKRKFEKTLGYACRYNRSDILLKVSQYCLQPDNLEDLKIFQVALQKVGDGCQAAEQIVQNQKVHFELLEKESLHKAATEMCRSIVDDILKSTANQIGKLKPLPIEKSVVTTTVIPQVLGPQDQSTQVSFPDLRAQQDNIRAQEQINMLSQRISKLKRELSDEKLKQSQGQTDLKEHKKKVKKIEKQQKLLVSQLEQSRAQYEILQEKKRELEVTLKSSGHRLKKTEKRKNDLIRQRDKARENQQAAQEKMETLQREYNECVVSKNQLNDTIKVLQDEVNRYASLSNDKSKQLVYISSKLEQMTAWYWNLYRSHQVLEGRVISRKSVFSEYAKIKTFQLGALDFLISKPMHQVICGALGVRIIKPDIQLLQALKKSIYPLVQQGAFIAIVGGFVRDLLSGHQAVNDIDLVCSLPQNSISEALNAPSVGYRHPIVRKELDSGKVVEISSLSTKSLKQSSINALCYNDSRSRDFNINSLYYILHVGHKYKQSCNKQQGAVVDPTGKGLEQLNEHYIGSIWKDRHALLQDDGYRIFRAIYLATSRQFKIKSKLSSAMRSAKVDDAIHVRYFQWAKKLFEVPYLEVRCHLLYEYNVLHYFFPKLVSQLPPIQGHYRHLFADVDKLDVEKQRQQYVVVTYLKLWFKFLRKENAKKSVSFEVVVLGILFCQIVHEEWRNKKTWDVVAFSQAHYMLTPILELSNPYVKAMDALKKKVCAFFNLIHTEDASKLPSLAKILIGLMSDAEQIEKKRYQVAQEEDVYDLSFE